MNQISVEITTMLMMVKIRYRALVYAWLKYARLPEMAGVGLQKQTFVAAGEGEFTFSCHMTYAVFTIPKIYIYGN